MFSSVWEQVEIPSLYSEEKLYDVFKQYTIEIDRKLNYPSNNIMTQAEFMNLWGKLNKKKEDQSATATADTNTAENNIVNDNLKKAPLVFIVMIALGFAFNFRRKTKR